MSHQQTEVAAPGAVEQLASGKLPYSVYEVHLAGTRLIQRPLQEGERGEVLKHALVDVLSSSKGRPQKEVLEGLTHDGGYSGYTSEGFLVSLKLENQEGEQESASDSFQTLIERYEKVAKQLKKLDGERKLVGRGRKAIHDLSSRRGPLEEELAEAEERLGQGVIVDFVGVPVGTYEVPVYEARRVDGDGTEEGGDDSPDRTADRSKPTSRGRRRAGKAARVGLAAALLGLTSCDLFCGGTEIPPTPAVTQPAETPQGPTTAPATNTPEASATPEISSEIEPVVYTMPEGAGGPEDLPQDTMFMDSMSDVNGELVAVVAEEYGNEPITIWATTRTTADVPPTGCYREASDKYEGTALAFPRSFELNGVGYNFIESESNGGVAVYEDEEGNKVALSGGFSVENFPATGGIAWVQRADGTFYLVIKNSDPANVLMLVGQTAHSLGDIPQGGRAVYDLMINETTIYDANGNAISQYNVSTGEWEAVETQSVFTAPELVDGNLDFEFTPRPGMSMEAALQAVEDSWLDVLRLRYNEAENTNLTLDEFRTAVLNGGIQGITFEVPYMAAGEESRLDQIYPLAPLVIEVHDKRNYDPTTSGAVAVTSAGAYIFNFSPEESRIVIYLDGATSDSPGVAEVDGFISAWLEGLNILWYGQASGLGTDEMVPNIDFLIDSLVYDRSGEVNPVIRNLNTE